MSALRAKPTVSVTEWANEQGWRKLRVLLIMPFDPFAQSQMDNQCRDRARWVPHRIVNYLRVVLQSAVPRFVSRHRSIQRISEPYCRSCCPELRPSKRPPYPVQTMKDSYVYDCNVVWVEQTSSTQYFDVHFSAAAPLRYNTVLLRLGAERSRTVGLSRFSPMLLQNLHRSVGKWCYFVLSCRQLRLSS